MSEKTILIWFRNDLRIHDNEILTEAVNRAEKVVPVYCFDPRYFTETRFGTKKTGPFRGKFLIESVESLRDSLRKLGGDLIIRVGKPEEILPEICDLYHVTEVYHHREVAPEETTISALAEDALWKQQINLKHFIGHTLYHKEDLPFPVRNIPNDFSVFRKKTERDSTVRPCFETPLQIRVPENMEGGNLPEMKDLGLTRVHDGEDSGFRFKGGEAEGLRRLRTLLPDYDAGNLVKSQSVVSLLSPWLSFGCLSPREVYWEVKNYQKRYPEISAGIITGLQWRDYFRFMLKKHGSILPVGAGIEGRLSGKEKKKFEKWKQGNTGEMLIDACMRQLSATGYLSEICRQYAGAYLVNKLGVSWLAGSAWFEDKAIDFSPASNLGHWAIILGGGVVPAKRKHVSGHKDVAREIDIEKWLPEYSQISRAG